MLSGDQTEFAIAMGFAKQAGNAETARNRAQARVRRMQGALTASQRRVAQLEAELAAERGRRLQREFLEIRNRLQ